MDKLLETLDRHHNFLLGVLLGIVGAFLVALFLSDWGDIAQALGNVIGAGVGAVGAAGAVVWQLRSQERKEAGAIRDLRRTAFRPIADDISSWVYRMEGAATLLVRGEVRRAAATLRAVGLRAFAVDNGFLDEFRRRSVSDLDALIPLQELAARIWVLSGIIDAADTDKEHDRCDLAGAIVAMCDAIIEFSDERMPENGKALGIGGSVRADIDLIVVTLRNAGLPQSRLAWLFREGL